MTIQTLESEVETLRAELVEERQHVANLEVQLMDQNEKLETIGDAGDVTTTSAVYRTMADSVKNEAQRAAQFEEEALKLRQQLREVTNERDRLAKTIAAGNYLDPEGSEFDHETAYDFS